MPDTQPTESIIPPTPVLPGVAEPRERPVLVTVIAVMILFFTLVVGLTNLLEAYCSSHYVPLLFNNRIRHTILSTIYYGLPLILILSPKRTHKTHVLAMICILVPLFQTFIFPLQTLLIFVEYLQLLTHIPQGSLTSGIYALGIFGVLYNIVLMILLNHPTVKAAFPNEPTPGFRERWKAFWR